MTKVKYLICTMMMLGCAACANFEDGTNEYTNLDAIENTLWYSYDVIQGAYYDIEFSDTAVANDEDWYEGTMLAYNSFERVERIDELCHNFTYNFTAAKDDVLAIVRTKFDDGRFYDGYVIPKGHMQISNKDVFIIQLFEVDKDGNLILTEDNNSQSTLMMWKE